ncbi:hypothetical protein [Amycolatopsis anabasis]|uniref:hypothetical protein n=1 Tax=Amycolatopsis anabasis TaxID=1840409 RepID=UPI00131B08DA|nr:hypothetical protein [Amycolatopsis anabasis]
MTQVSLRNLADLARAGFEIARQPLTKVDFEIHHVAARPGFLRELVADGFLETVCSAANGAAVAIGTHTRNRLDSIVDEDQHDGPTGTALPQRSADGWVFHQSAWPNPTFIYESARTFEGLVSIDPDAKELSDWHGLAVRNLMQEISEAATKLAGAPLLTLQCPAQLPPIVKTRNHDLRTRKELPSVCSAFAIRFSVALQDASAEQQIVLSNRIRELCEENGFGFWIADTRPGHRPGNWFEVCRTPARDDDRPEKPVTTCLPVTCAGPARVGSTHAIMSFLRRYPRVGVVGCSGTSLADLAFVHLQLSVEGVSSERLNKILEKLYGEETVPVRPRELLRKLFGRLGLRAENSADKRADATGPASDYQTFVGPAFDYRPSATTHALPVWVSWQIARKDDGLAAPVECLYRALRQVVPELALPGEPVAPLSEVAAVEYLICRATEQSVVRGKGKLAVPKPVLEQFGGVPAEDPASKLCASLEEAWKAQIDLAEVRGVSELTVAWREAWLGHWTYY